MVWVRLKWALFRLELVPLCIRLLSEWSGLAQIGLVLVGACFSLFLPASEEFGLARAPFRFEFVSLCFRLLLSGSGLAQMGLCSGWILFFSVFA